MARFTTLSRKDLEFMAEDIGQELIAVMSPEDIVKSMSTENRIRLARIGLEKLSNSMDLEKLLAQMTPKTRKKFIDSVLKMQAATLASNRESNGNQTA